MKKLSFLFLLMVAGSNIQSQDINKLELTDVNSANKIYLKNIINKKAAFIIFIDNTCAFVDSYDARLTFLSKQLTNKGHLVLFVNPHEKNNPATDNVNASNEFFANKNWTGKYYSDTNQDLVKLLGATKLPEVYFVTLQGTKLNVIYQGAIDDNPQNEKAVKTTYITTAEEMKANGENVSPTKVPPLGCRIKRF